MAEFSGTAVTEAPFADTAHRSAPVLEARGITKTYRTGLWPHRRSLPVLRGADVVLAPGEIVGLAGENGSGKSTLMKVLVGSLPRDGGSVARSGQLGYCPQDPILYERLTCDEHFELFGRAYGMTAPEVEMARDAIYDAYCHRLYARTPPRHRATAPKYGGAAA